MANNGSDQRPYGQEQSRGDRRGAGAGGHRNGERHDGGRGPSHSRPRNNRDSAPPNVRFDSRNLQYIFQVEYLAKSIERYIANHKKKEDDPKVGAEMNKKLLAAGNNQRMWEEIRPMLAAREERIKAFSGGISKSMRVLYPGLIIGVGYPHMTKQVTGEIQLGFSFDPITGAPYYPGSSVKGVVRHVFTMAAGKKKTAKEDAHVKRADQERAESYRAYLLDILRDVDEEAWKGVDSLTPEDIRAFVIQSFGDVIAPAKAKTAAAPLDRDIFYDAYIVGQGKNDVFGLDNIAPHTDDNGLPAPTKDPVPVTFLRILPGSKITFLMKLHDACLGSVNVSAKVKQELYARILQDFGIGAKTNVGYGALESC